MTNKNALNGPRVGMGTTVALAAALYAVVAVHLCVAEGLDNPTVGGGRAGQDDAVRTRSAVQAVGRWVVDHYADKQLAVYGILDVTKAPYSADPTGEKDSTRAIQHALKDARDARLITYLPGGTYRVSDTITCIQGVVAPNHWLFGRSDPWASPNETLESDFNNWSFRFPCVLTGSRGTKRSRIILVDRSTGFGNPRRPKPMIHFWARSETEEETPSGPDPNKPEPDISYNQMIVDIDLILGKGNLGAVGIDHQAAQGSAIEDVTIDATGAFAGIHKAPGSGGGIHGLTVIGGRYGLFLKGDPDIFLGGAQPVPVVSNVTLRGQTELSILYTGRGPLTVVGGRIEGAGVEAQGPTDAPWNGAMSFIDTVFSTPKAACAVRSNHSVYLHNDYFKNAKTIACIEEQPELTGQPERWTHVEEYAASATLQYPPRLGGALRPDAVYVNGQPAPGVYRMQDADSAAPPVDLQSRHAWSPLPSWDSPAVVNVRAAPYSARGDGKADDAAAIQRAIDENETVFLPKGTYKLSRPLVLRSKTRLFGVSNVLSVLSPMSSSNFEDPEHPAPLIDTVDDPRASTVLAFVELSVPIINPTVYALRWRAGRHSVVRNIRAEPASWKPLPLPALHPMIGIEGSGGGRWYDLYQGSWWSQGPDYRHLLVEGTREPLSFYMLNPEHSRSDAQVELHDARNISIYSLKSEGSYNVLWMRDCFDIRVYGYGGMTTTRANWPLFRVDNSDNFLLANVDPDLQRSGPGSWYSDPRKWFLITDAPGASRAHVGLRGIDQVVLYKRGNPQPVH